MVSVVQVNYVFDKGLPDPDALLARYETLTGWGEAVAAAGAGRVAAVQQFHHDARLTRNGVEYVFTAGGARAVAEAVARLQPDVAHINGLIFPARTWLLRRALPAHAAIVVQNHSDGGAIGRAPWLRAAGRVTRRVIDAFLMAAPEHATAWRAAGIIAPDQPVHYVMPAGTTLRAVDRAAARAATGVHGSPAVLWVGRLNANKDPLTVLDAFERCLATFPAAALTMIYGTDEWLPAVRDRIDRSPSLKARVRLAGAVAHREIAPFFSAADIFVVGSHHEGSGYAVMEACACGAVPAVTDIPTFRLLAGGVGALWRPGDAADCARALAEIASRDFDAERARLADHLARNLTWEAVGRRALAIYQDVMRDRACNSANQGPGATA
jgi:glycosyltransferase involved in cell wall biosynthesis